MVAPGIHWFPSGVDFGNLAIPVALGTSPETGEGVLLSTDSGPVNVGGNGQVLLGSGPTAGTHQGLKEPRREADTPDGQCGRDVASETPCTTPTSHAVVEPVSAASPSSKPPSSSPWS